MKPQPKNSRQIVPSIQVTSREGHVASGINALDERVMVLNGDLLPGSSIPYIEKSKKPGAVWGEIPETFDNHILQEQVRMQNKDHLVPTGLLTLLHRPYVFLPQDKWVFAERKIYGVCDYLLENNHLWKQAELALSHTRKTAFSAVRYGIPFPKALEKIGKALVKSRLYGPQEKQDKAEGAVAEMLVYTSLDNRGLFTIECWQGVADGGPVFYMHGIMNRDRTLFTHFDGAEIQFDPADKERLFKEDIKIKGGMYKKLFKLNGIIQPQEVYEIAARFFPLEELIDEYFQISPIV